MLKKTLLIISLVCVLGILALFFVFLRKQHTNDRFEALHVIPINTFCVIQVNNSSALANNIVTDNPIWTGLRAIPAIDNLSRNLMTIDSLVSSSEKLGTFLDKRSAIISLHFTRNMDYDYLFAINMENEMNTESCIKLLKSLGSKPGSFSSYKYDLTTVYHLTTDTPNNGVDFYFTIINNIFVASTTKVLVQASIGQVHSKESLLKNKNFALVHNSSDIDKDANIYLNYKEIPKFFSLFSSTAYTPAIRQSTHVAGWEELDVSLKEKMLFMSGIVTTDSISDNYYDIFSGQEPQNFEIQSVLPASLSVFVAMSISDPQTFRKNHNNYLKARGLYSKQQAILNASDTILGTAIDDLMFEIIDNEMCAIISGTSPDSGTTKAFAVIRTKSKSLTEEKMNALLQAYATRTNQTIQSFTTQYKIDNDAKFDIIKLPVSQIPRTVFGDMFSWSSSEYYVIIDNYLVMGSSVASLSAYIKEIVLNKSIKNDSKFKSVETMMTENYNLFIYSNISHSGEFLKQILKPEFASFYDNYTDVFKNFQTGGYHLTQNNGRLFNTICFTYDTQDLKAAQTMWESHLDTSVSVKPTLVMNPQTNEKEILVQDDRNNLYLLNKAGRILWKQLLKEHIESEIFQVDYYKNGKKQFAFSTKNFIYIIDRIGNFVEHYPQQLKSPASAGLAVFDYDNNKNYRMLIPCTDKKVYAYTIEGKILKDWAFDKTEEPVLTPVSHFRINTFDYIVFNDSYNVYILNRKGEKRVDVKEKFEVSRNSKIGVDATNVNECKHFITTDKKGNIKLIAFDGSVTTTDLGSFSPGHFIDTKDINNDGYNELIITDAEMLYVYTIAGKRIFKFECSGNIEQAPSFFDFGNANVKIGVVSGTNIYLINNDGRLYDGFPLQGNTPFSIGYFIKQSENFNLVVGGNENCIYNYEIK